MTFHKPVQTKNQDIKQHVPTSRNGERDGSGGIWSRGNTKTNLREPFVGKCRHKTRLANVDDFCRSFADAVHPQKLPSSGVEDQLEEPVGSSKHLALRQLLVIGDSHLTCAAAKETSGLT